MRLKGLARPSSGGSVDVLIAFTRRVVDRLKVRLETGDWISENGYRRLESHADKSDCSCLRSGFRMLSWLSSMLAPFAIMQPSWPCARCGSWLRKHWRACCCWTELCTCRRRCRLARRLGWHPCLTQPSLPETTLLWPSRQRLTCSSIGKHRVSSAFMSDVEHPLHMCSTT